MAQSLNFYCLGVGIVLLLISIGNFVGNSTASGAGCVRGFRLGFHCFFYYVTVVMLAGQGDGGRFVVISPFPAGLIVVAQSGNLSFLGVGYFLTVGGSGSSSVNGLAGLFAGGRSSVRSDDALQVLLIAADGALQVGSSGAVILFPGKGAYVIVLASFTLLSLRDNDLTPVVLAGSGVSGGQTLVTSTGNLGITGCALHGDIVECDGIITHQAVQLLVSAGVANQFFDSGGGVVLRPLYIVLRGDGVSMTSVLSNGIIPIVIVLFHGILANGADIGGASVPVAIAVLGVVGFIELDIVMIQSGALVHLAGAVMDGAAFGAAFLSEAVRAAEGIYGDGFIGVAVAGQMACRDGLDHIGAPHEFVIVVDLILIAPLRQIGIRHIAAIVGIIVGLLKLVAVTGLVIDAIFTGDEGKVGSDGNGHFTRLRVNRHGGHRRIINGEVVFG